MGRYLSSLAAVVLAALVVLLRRRIAVVTVEGESMLPSFAAGDRVLVHCARGGSPRPGQVVVVEKPDEAGAWTRPRRRALGNTEWMIKRVAAAPGDRLPGGCLPATSERPEGWVPAGKLVLLGDNPARSYDSRDIGYFPAERLLGTVMRKIAPR